MNIVDRMNLAMATGRNALFATALVLMGAHSASAGEAVNALENGVAMDGFDVVAYFTENSPKIGSAEYSVDYKGKSWRFSSSENATKFSTNPASFEPQNNGWCSYAVSEGYGAEVDFVNGWAVINDKLYLNWDQETRDLFIAEQTTRIAQAETNWPLVHSGLKDGTVEFYTHEAEGAAISHPQTLN